MPPTPQNDEDGPGTGLTTAADREETETITNGHSQDSKQYEGSPDIDGNEKIDAEYNRLMNYPSDDDEADYYGLLGLSRDPPPKDAEIRSAYRILTLSFHPDKQPAHLREPAEKQFTRIRDAYETLIDPQKRTVYNLLGAEGVRQEWSHGGLMGRRGDAERQELGVKTMSPEEFRRWFLGTMKARERKVVDSLVQSRVRSRSLTLIVVDPYSTIHSISLLLSKANLLISMLCTTGLSHYWSRCFRHDFNRRG